MSRDNQLDESSRGRENFHYEEKEGLHFPTEEAYCFYKTLRDIVKSFLKVHYPTDQQFHETSLSPAVNSLSPLEYKDFRKRMILQGHFRRNFLSKLPPDVKRRIQEEAFISHYSGLMHLQLNILYAVHDQNLRETNVLNYQRRAFTVHQRIENPLFKLFPTSMLLAEIDLSDKNEELCSSLFHAGMLIILNISKRASTPSFLGPKVSSYINLFRENNNYPVSMYCISSAPQLDLKGIFTPAYHQIILSVLVPLSHFKIFPYAFEHLTETFSYQQYTQENVKQLSLTSFFEGLELLCETSTVSLWVALGEAQNCRSRAISNS